MPLLSLNDHFPPVEWACAYGSAAITQDGYDASRSMLDFIFVVKDTTTWHIANRQYNPKHYASRATFDPFLQRIGAGILYNTDVKLSNGLVLPFGETNKFLQDLYEWNTLYVAGRLHKPVVPLFPSPPPPIEKALLANYSHAINVALLLLPQSFKANQLLQTIVQLSFQGDFRIGLAEDPRKVERIVNGQRDALWSIYQSFLHHNISNGLLIKLNGEDHYEQSDEPLVRLNRLCSLPGNLLLTLKTFKEGDPFHLYTQPKKLATLLSKSISRTVRGPALSQAIKGILTAGPTKAFAYALVKLGKRLL